MPFTTKMNNPRVSTVRGSVKMRMNGRITAFTNPSSSAAMMRWAAVSIFTPGTIVVAAQRPSAVMTRR